MKRIILALTLLIPVALSNAQITQADAKYTITVSGKDVEQYKAMMPSSMRTVLKGQNSKLIMDGMMQSMIGDIISKGDEKSTYYVNHAMKTVNKTAIEESKSEKPTVTKENSTAKILGYSCDKYKVITKEGGRETTLFVWACKDLKVERPKDKSGAGKYMFDGVDGFPLKMELNINENGVAYTMIMTASSVSFDGISDDEFEIPSSYKVQEGLPMLLQMQKGQ